MRTIVVASTLAMLMASATAEEAFTGTTLLEMCSHKTEGVRTMCDAWMNGFQAGFDVTNGPPRGTLGSICLPDGFTGKQARLIIENYMKEQPQMLHLDAEVIAFYALWSAYPCK
jgi:hypothetical protein